MTEGHASRGEQDPPSRLARRLGTADAVFIGLGAMVGAGIFAALGPASEAAGGGLLIGLALAAVVAACNATSSAQLSAWLAEWGLPPGPVRPLPIREIAPGLRVEGPVPQLEPELRELYRRCFAPRAERGR